jgi:hypothetical protein
MDVANGCLSGENLQIASHGDVDTLRRGEQCAHRSNGFAHEKSLQSQELSVDSSPSNP